MGSYADTTLSEAGQIIGDGKIVVLEPEKWVGKRFPLLDYIDIGDKLKEGKWLVMLYHHNCPNCREAIHGLRLLAEQAGVHSVAMIEMPPYLKSPSGFGSREVTLLHGRLSDRHKWFAETPFVLTLQDGNTIEADQASRMK